MNPNTTTPFEEVHPRRRRRKSMMRLPQLNKANRLARRFAEGRTIITIPRAIERAFSQAS